MCTCRDIALFAAKRARDRVGLERALFEEAGAPEATAGGGAVDEARLALQDAAKLSNVATQVAGKRPVQGVAVSPDSGTLATADWSGIVTFWRLDESLTFLNNSQVCLLPTVLVSLLVRLCTCMRGEAWSERQQSALQRRRPPVLPCLAMQRCGRRLH